MSAIRSISAACLLTIVLSMALSSAAAQGQVEIMTRDLPEIYYDPYDYYNAIENGFDNKARYRVVISDEGAHIRMMNRKSTSVGQVSTELGQLLMTADSVFTIQLFRTRAVKIKPVYFGLKSEGRISYYDIDGSFYPTFRDFVVSIFGSEKAFKEEYARAVMQTLNGGNRTGLMGIETAEDARQFLREDYLVNIFLFPDSIERNTQLFLNHISRVTTNDLYDTDSLKERLLTLARESDMSQERHYTHRRLLHIMTGGKWPVVFYDHDINTLLIDAFDDDEFAKIEGYINAQDRRRRLSVLKLVNPERESANVVTSTFNITADTYHSIKGEVFK